ncbi:hypothetical protein [Proteus columbae]|uniref:hypothetical protein n=1 Tax=Proteus columbae TaxID=1987580 RepID=UPI00288AA297|nr:hypothetical protein [Proteus columbae]
MFINQNQREEFELARSCLEREQRLPVRHHHKKDDVTTSGFTRKKALELLTTFYRECGHGKGRREFFKRHRTSQTEFQRVIEWFDFDIKRYFQVDDGQLYLINWKPIREVLKQERLSMAVTKHRNTAFKKGYADTKELFVELVCVRYSHYYNNPKEFFEVLRKVDISRGTFYNRVKKYNIKAKFFMSVDNGEIFQIKNKSSK